MPHQITKTVYNFDELDDKAKEKAREWWREAIAGDNFWSESVIEDANTIAKILGIEFDGRSRTSMSGKPLSPEPKIYWSGFCSQGDGACFEGRYSYAKGCAKAIREYAPKDAELHRIADQLTAIQKEYFYAIQATMKHRGHYYHSGCMEFTVTAERDNLKPLGDNEDAIVQLMRDFADWIYKQLEAEYDYRNADEYVDEAIKVNDYEFTKEGKRAS